jgi:uncharacterized protein YndB with AHSA1/START domain/predicted enzyme related to lactoylglutathione lyase
MKIKLASILVRDQEKALEFYTKVLGFVKKRDDRMGEFRWLTVVSADDPEGVELVLEPTAFPPSSDYQAALFESGIPITALAVEDIHKEFDRLTRLGVKFHTEPEMMGPVTPITRAVFDDTCGNLIQLYQPVKENRGLVAEASTTINAPLSEVWDALVNPEKIARYMFGTKVTSDWKEGSPIVWKGEWQGKEYEDRGVIKRLVPGHVIEYSHFSPLSGKSDKPENYHTVSVELSMKGKATRVRLTQDNNANEEELEHSEKNWNAMLEGLKKLVEG